MKTVDFLKQEDFPALLMLIKKFSETTDTPFHVHVNEVSQSLMGEKVITIIGKDDEKEFPLVAYLNGFKMDTGEFMLSQMYSEDPTLTPIIGDFLDEHLLSIGVTKIFALFKHLPRAAEKYGFQLDRYLISKVIKRGGKDE